jgi:hypothetical protein
MPRAVLFGVEPGAIGAVHASLLGELFHPGNLVNQNAGRGQQLDQGPLSIVWELIPSKRGHGQKLGKGPLHKGSALILLNPPPVV